MTTKTDSFPTVQNPLSGHWTTLTAAGLKCTAAGVVKGTSASTQDNGSIWATTDYAFANDQTASVTCSSLGNFDWVGVVVRGSGSGASSQGYVAYVEPESSAVALFKLSGGTVGPGGSYLTNWTGLTITGSHTLELDVTGTTLTVKWDGTTLGTFTDSTYTSGQPGVMYQFGNSDASQINSFTATDSAGGSGAAFAGKVAGKQSATGAVSTAIRPAGAAKAKSSLTGAIATSIRPAGGARAKSIATSALSTAIRPSGGARAKVTARAPLSTSIRLTSGPRSVWNAIAALTNWATVTLAGPLYTGPGGVLNPSFWPPGSVPVVGDVLYYDPTHMTVLSNGEAVTTSDSFAAVIQFYDGTQWQLGEFVVTPQLSSYPGNVHAANGALSTSIALVGGIRRRTSITGPLTTRVALASIAGARSTNKGPLSTQISLGSHALSYSKMTGGLTGAGAFLMVGHMGAKALMTTALSTGISLIGKSGSKTSVRGPLSTSIPLGSKAASTGSLRGSIATSISMKSKVAHVASVYGSLATSIALGSADHAVASFVANLGSRAAFAGRAYAVGRMTAILTTGIALESTIEWYGTSSGSIASVFVRGISVPPQKDDRRICVPRLH